LQVQVFPNPVADQVLNLKLDQAAQETYEVSISNIVGAVVATAQLERGVIQKSVDISHLSQGHYFVKVTNSSGQMVAMQRIARL
jgi:YbbR domain-containing protein